MLKGLYNKIRNPLTGQLVKTKSEKGRKVINQHVNLCGLVYLVEEQLNTGKRQNRKRLSLNEYLQNRLHELETGYIRKSAKLFKDFMIYILQLKLLNFYLNKFNNKSITVKEKSEIQINMHSILVIVKDTEIIYSELKENGIDGFIENNLKNRLYYAWGKTLKKTESDKILNLDIKDIVKYSGTNSFRIKMKHNIIIANDALHKIHALIITTIDEAKGIITRFEKDHKINTQNKGNIEKYKRNEGVLTLKAQRNRGKSFKDPDTELKLIDKEWDKIAMNNIDNLILEDKTPICAERNKQGLYDVCPDYKDCYKQLKVFLNKTEIEINDLDEINEKLEFLTDPYTYGSKIGR
tara:strand:+ start:58 stop:1110 length:1053 start_codon:yes stop_codon:yes gene_type:complete